MAGEACDLCLWHAIFNSLFSNTHNTLCLPPPPPPPKEKKVHKLLFWEYAVLPREFENNSLWKIWAANKVYYGQLENR